MAQDVNLYLTIWCEGQGRRAVPLTPPAAPPTPTALLCRAPTRISSAASVRTYRCTHATVNGAPPSFATPRIRCACSSAQNTCEAWIASRRLPLIPVRPTDSMTFMRASAILLSWALVGACAVGPAPTAAAPTPVSAASFASAAETVPSATSSEPSSPAADTRRALSASAAPQPKAKTRSEDDCERECDGQIMTRHDACGKGHGPPWPTWCADDNARWRRDCLLRCGGSE
jgi:hypothetical protein